MLVDYKNTFVNCDELFTNPPSLLDYVFGFEIVDKYLKRRYGVSLKDSEIIAIAHSEQSIKTIPKELTSIRAPKKRFP